MTIMSDGDVLNAIYEEGLEIDPFNKDNLGPASYDVTLSDHFVWMKPGAGIIQLDQPAEYEEVHTNKFVLAPGEFVLAASVERIKFPPNVGGSISGRSSLGRLGLFVENAGWFDPGFDGNCTLELYNAGKYPIQLLAGWRIAQMIFFLMDNASVNPYSGKYKGKASTGAVGSLVHEDE